MNVNLHTILCVDDEQNILNSLKRLLRKEGYRLLTAGSGAEGLKILAENDIHLVISDQRMPEMNRTEFLGKVKEIYPEVIRIVLSGYTEVDSITELINKEHIYKFMLKPWNDNDLKVTVRQAIEALELIYERDSLLQQVKAQDAFLHDLEKEFPGISKVERDEDEYIIIDR